MMLARSFLAVSALAALTDAARYSRTESYIGQKVVRCGNVTAVAAHTISTSFDVFAVRDTTMDVRVANRQEMDALTQLAPSCTIVADVEEMVVEFEKDLNQSHATANNWFEEYHTFPEIINWYEGVASDFERITKWVPRIGQSYEGRDMAALHITGVGGGATKKTMYWQCQIHAREWITGAVCMYLVDYLTNNYGINNEVTALLDSIELIVVPFSNPDGYEYTWSNTRLWRKNRQPNPGSTCVGTDLNRNYDEHWGEGGGSTNPCSDTYQGARAWSGPEARVTSDYFTQHAPIYSALDWHAYSQLVLRPWGWTEADAPDEPLLKSAGDLFRDEAGKFAGTRFVSQKSIGLYPTTGTANDWFYGDDASSQNQGFRAYGFTIELRDTGRYGFQLPASQIIPSGQEMVPAAMAFLTFTRDNNLRYSP